MGELKLELRVPLIIDSDFIVMESSKKQRVGKLYQFDRLVFDL